MKWNERPMRDQDCRSMSKRRSFRFKLDPKYIYNNYNFLIFGAMNNIFHVSNVALQCTCS